MIWSHWLLRCMAMLIKERVLLRANCIFPQITVFMHKRHGRDRAKYADPNVIKDVKSGVRDVKPPQTIRLSPKPKSTSSLNHG